LPDTVAVVPIKSNIARRPAGALVVGISPHLRLDKAYAGFLELVSARIATTVANARAYEEERRRAAALAEIDRAKTAFFSNVSHEFRTPLTLMLGPLEDALASQAIPDPERARLDVAHRNSLRLLKLVNSLLDFARIEAGRVQASYVPLDLAGVTCDLASNFRSAVERAGLAFEVDCSRLAAQVFVDREMWEKIVLNLVSNAFKYTLEGRIAVRLRDGGTEAILEVADTGVGIAEHELPRLFERFYRVAGSAARTHEGTGIGLSLVQELVKLHGGTLEVDSELTRGSTFRVRIPYGREHLPAERIGASTSLPSTAVTSQAYVQEALRWLPGTEGTRVVRPEPFVQSALADQRFAATHGARVVLADDNADMRAYVAGLLGSMYSIEAVGDGAQALEAARRERPDLIITDVMMPVLDGFGLLEALNADAALRDVPVILLSARAGEEARIEGLSAGADDYVVKPFAARELTARVGALLELSHTRRATQEVLIQQRRDLEIAAQQKDEFLAMLAHELRNPLAPIRNSSELLARQLPEDGPLCAAVQTIGRQVTHLTRLVDDLLDVSRITHGRIELVRRPTAVADIVARSLETVDPLIRARGHQVRVVTSPAKLHVNVDTERLVQCLSNGLTNAAKYTPPGGKIHVETSDSNGEVTMQVRDNGDGISPELLPRVFELFVQGERTLDRSQGGLGIGLSIVKRLIEMHDGAVRVTSDGERQGTTFEIRLPLLAESVAVPTEPSTAASRPRRVLVVDDNEDATNTLAMILQLEGHEIRTAYSGVDALVEAGQFHPEVVLLDIGLPGLDGYQVAEQLRALTQRRDLRLIAITGYGQVTDRKRTQDAGFANHLVKPVDFAELKKVLDSLDG